MQSTQDPVHLFPVCVHVGVTLSLSVSSCHFCCHLCSLQSAVRDLYSSDVSVSPPPTSAFCDGHIPFSLFVCCHDTHPPQFRSVLSVTTSRVRVRADPSCKTSAEIQLLLRSQNEWTDSAMFPPPLPLRLLLKLAWIPTCQMTSASRT